MDYTSTDSHSILNKLSLDSYIKHIFFEEQVLDLFEILLALKQYKLFDESELSDYILNDYNVFMSDKNEIITFPYLDMRKTPKEVNREPRLGKTEEDAHVIIDKVDRSTYNVYVPLGIKVDTLGIENVVGASECNFYKVAPDWFADVSGFKPIPRAKLKYKAIVYDAIKQKASDVHLTAISVGKEIKYPIHYRINDDYILSEKYGYLSGEKEQSDIVTTMLQGTAVVATNLGAAHGASVSIPNLFGPDTVILRVNITTNFKGYDFSARIQTQDSLAIEIGTLGFDSETVNSLLKTSLKKSGLTIITGKFKSGKTITMMALSKEMQKYAVKQYGVFSPMEFKVPFGVKEYNDDLDILLEEVSQIKKKDVDIVHLNEIPNQEVGLAAWDLINSNVHVVTTTHLNRLWHLPHKLYELYGNRFRDLITQLNVVYNQKMFIRICPRCREHITLDLNLVSPLYRQFLTDYNISGYYKAKGCSHCINGKARGGYHPIVEFLEFDNKIINELLMCQTNADMEKYINNLLTTSKASLEYKVANDIRAGEIGLDAIQHFI